MTNELFAGLLVFLGAVLAAVLFVLDRQGKRLNVSIPAEFLPVVMGLLALAETLARSTATLDDDALIARLREALGAADEPEFDPEAEG